METAIDTLADSAALALTARLIDLAGDLRREDGLRHALALADELATRDLAASDSAVLNYFRANTWANIETAKRKFGAHPWSWDQPEAEQQILCLRRALTGGGFDELDWQRRCQILTNLGNLLDAEGRFVEAQAYWSRALRISPHFWMARGNRGIGLTHYARAIHDPGHQRVFLLFAHRDLEGAATPPKPYDKAGPAAVRRLFEQWRDWVAARADLPAIEQSFRPDGWSLGRSRDERAYRIWCLQNTLFLNPLNDLAPHAIGAKDVLTLPDFTTPLDEPPNLIGFFNQIKQEFVSARWTLYEGTHATRVHFSDRGVRLYNTLDYPSYSLATERVKFAYRATYSVFDKIAFFLNYYLKLGIPAKRVSFRKLWRDKNGDAIHPIREQFGRSENWPLRGLFWLSKDLFDGTIAAETEPEARELHDLRDHLEHKYLKAHEMLTDRSGPFQDTLAHSVLRADLQEKTLRLLKLARAALIYLCLAMHREEQRRRAANPKALTVPMPIDLWEDNWKL